MSVWCGCTRRRFDGCACTFVRALPWPGSALALRCFTTCAGFAGEVMSVWCGCTRRRFDGCACTLARALSWPGSAPALYNLCGLCGGGDERGVGARGGVLMAVPVPLRVPCRGQALHLLLFYNLCRLCWGDDERGTQRRFDGCACTFERALSWPGSAPACVPCHGQALHLLLFYNLCRLCWGDDERGVGARGGVLIAVPIPLCVPCRGQARALPWPGSAPEHAAAF